MAMPVDVRCSSCQGDPSALRLTVAQTVWYLLDVTDDGFDADQPEVAGEPTMQLVCLDCGHEGPFSPNTDRCTRGEATRAGAPFARARMADGMKRPQARSLVRRSTPGGGAPAQ
jgi:hypothetical protein